MAARLKAENVPVLLSLNFPRRPNASPDADPEPLRMLKARVEAPKLAAKLAQAGVRFAFEDGGLSTWSEFLDERRPHGRGRSDGRSGGARADGVARRDPRRERSTRHDRSRQDRQPHGDARRSVHRPREPAVRRRRGGRDSRAGRGRRASMANGTWQITVTTDEGERSVTLASNQVGDQLRGTIQGALGSATINNGSIAHGRRDQVLGDGDDGRHDGGSDVLGNDRGERRARHDDASSDIRSRRSSARSPMRPAGRTARSSADAALAVAKPTESTILYRLSLEI